MTGGDVDGATHRYKLDVRDLMNKLELALSDRGYEVYPDADGKTWIFQTPWGRGAARGEVGSILYGLIADTLSEID